MFLSASVVFELCQCTMSDTARIADYPLLVSPAYRGHGLPLMARVAAWLLADIQPRLATRNLRLVQACEYYEAVAVMV